MPLSRSLLVIPANRPDLVESAAASAADIVVLDLAGVPEPYKDAGRAAIGPALASLKALSKHVHVRVDSIASGLARDDLIAAISGDLDGLELPAVRSPQDVRDLDVLIREQETGKGLKPGNIVLVAIIASARALLRCAELPEASTRLAAIALAGAGYAADLGVPQSRAALEYARRYVVTCATAWGLRSFEAALGEPATPDGVITDARYARSIGFQGKYIAAAGDIATMNEVFTPQE